MYVAIQEDDNQWVIFEVEILTKVIRYFDLMLSSCYFDAKNMMSATIGYIGFVSKM